MHCVSKHVRLSEPTTKIWMKIVPYSQRRRCSPVTLDSGNIWFVRIFPCVPNDSEVIKNVDFQDFRTLRLRHLRKWGQHYYVVSAPCCLSTDLKIQTLNGHFAFNFQFSLLRTAFRRLGYILIVELFIEYFCTTSPQRCAEADGDPQNIWNPRKKLRTFRRRCIVGTIKNKANIYSI